MEMINRKLSLCKENEEGKIIVTKEEIEEIIGEARMTVLRDFDNICCADAFMGFTDEEFKAIKKFFKFNNDLNDKNK